MEWLSFSASSYRPPWPVMGVALFLMIAGGLAWWSYWRQRRGGWFFRGMLLAVRLGVLAALGWTLLGPSAVLPGAWSDRPIPLRILIDTSASMAEPDAELDGKPATRIDALRSVWLSVETLDRLERVADVSVTAFDRETRRISPETAGRLEAGGDQTALYAALRKSLAEPTPDAVTLLLSDGHDTHGESTRLPADRGPVFTVPIGRGEATPDLGIQAWFDADTVFEGQAVTLRAAVLQRGYADRDIVVTLRDEAGVVERRALRLNDAPITPLAFMLEPVLQNDEKVGVRGYEIEVAATDPAYSDERDMTNNARPAFVEVTREKMRVVLLEGQPYWDTRDLARVLANDPNITFTAVYRLGPDRTVVRRDGGAGDAWPPEKLSQRWLDGFDVVILGRGAERFFPDEEAVMLTDYVERRGGALVLARGQPFGDTADGQAARRIVETISPVAWGRGVRDALRLELTPQGQSNPVFEPLSDDGVVLSRFPEMLAATRIEAEKAASVVYLRQRESNEVIDQSPMASVASMRVGRGQVFAVLGDGLWQWSLATADGEAAFVSFWQRAIHWLAAGGEFLPGQEVALSLSRRTAEPGEPIQATVTARYFIDDAIKPRLSRISPDGRDSPVTLTPDPQRPGIWHGTLTPRAIGIHRLELRAADGDAAPLTTRLAVDERSTERLDPAARPDVLERIAMDTGGQCLAWNDTDTLTEAIEDLRTARQADPRYRDDFARWPVFALIVGGLGFEWIARRRGGLA